MDVDLAANIEQVRTQLARAAETSGRTAADVHLLAVSKTHSADVIRALAQLGQVDFAESRLQEARVKIPELPSRLRWHFIGHLQSNKARAILSLFERIHSVDSLELLQHLARVSAEAGVYPKVLLQVNVAGESSKFGFAPSRLLAQLDEILAAERLQIDGLMAIPPLAARPEISRPYFVQLRQLRDKIEARSGIRLAHLSMGMSNDFPIAVEEGATMVRVGTALFGARGSRLLR
ncbi:MAG TPA: YggS family pyridoxal phosphate-dependent enzyme [Chthoniobacterales bacterium]